MGRCGSLLLTRLDDVAEVKRMYVRALARGRSVGRLLLQRLVTDARAEGYRIVQLETLSFMTEACPLPFARFRRDGRL